MHEIVADPKNRLIMYTALLAAQKVIKSEIDLLKREVTEDMVEAYEQNGSDRSAVRIGDKKVASVSLVFANESISVVDEFAFYDWQAKRGDEISVPSIDWDKLTDKGRERVKKAAGKAYRETITYKPAGDYDIVEVNGQPIEQSTGEVVLGVEVIPPHIKGISVRDLKPSKELLPAIVSAVSVRANLLGGE